MAVAERINQLGGAPNSTPRPGRRSASEYAAGSDLAAMIRENLIAERIAVDHYRELICFFGDYTGHARMIEGFSPSRRSTPATCWTC